MSNNRNRTSKTDQRPYTNMVLTTVSGTRVPETVRTTDTSPGDTRWVKHTHRATRCELLTTEERLCDTDHDTCRKRKYSCKSKEYCRTFRLPNKKTNTFHCEKNSTNPELKEVENKTPHTNKLRLNISMEIVHQEYFNVQTRGEIEQALLQQAPREDTTTHLPNSDTSRIEWFPDENPRDGSQAWPIGIKKKTSKPSRSRSPSSPRKRLRL